MITTSERAVTVTIWMLTAAGIFFGGRAVWRRRGAENRGAHKCIDNQKTSREMLHRST